MHDNWTDAQLVAACLAAGEPKFFGELVRRHQSAVRAFLRHLDPGNSAGADDLAQETFLLAYRTLAKFRPAGRFDTWLLGQAYNLHRNAARKSRIRESDTLDERTAAPEADPAARFAREHDFAQALGSLDPEEQRVIHACYTQMLSHSEAALVLDLPVGTVKTQIARAKQKLKTLLASWKTNA